MDLPYTSASRRSCTAPSPLCRRIVLAVALAAVSGATLAQDTQEEEPTSVDSHLEAGLAYLEAGDFANAKLEFETVLRLEDLPPDLRLQAEIYAESARNYLAGNRLDTSGYGLFGGGNYRENSTSAGSGNTNDMFAAYRFGGRMNYRASDDLSFNNSLDYRFRYYDDSARRNDSDLRWNTALSRALGENNVEVGLRGRVSFRGDGNYRNDYGLYGDWRLLIDEDDQVTLGAEYRRRRYPSGAERDRSRNIAELSAAWTRALMDGRASFTLTARGGREYAAQRVDGDSNFYGLTPEFSFTFNDRWSGFLFAFWENARYNVERLGSEGDDLPIPTRNDNLYELGGGLTWDFAEGWSLNPEVLYIRDQSNIVSANYSSIETWVMLRKDF